MIRSGLIIAFLAASAASALAHHGFGTFDLQRSVTYAGKLTRLEFINPHSWLYFEVTDANRKVDEASVRDALGPYACDGPAGRRRCSRSARWSRSTHRPIGPTRPPAT